MIYLKMCLFENIFDSLYLIHSEWTGCDADKRFLFFFILIWHERAAFYQQYIYFYFTEDLYLIAQFVCFNIPFWVTF